MIGRPDETEYGPAFGGYVARVPESEILSVLELQRLSTHHFVSSIPRDRASFRYADGKWSIREVIGHLIDTERIMGYRATAIARGEKAPLPGFDENVYVANAGFESVLMEELIEELDALRHSHILLFRHLSPEAWMRRGHANGMEMTPRALAYIIAGHQRHHLAVLEERYGVGSAGTGKQGH